MTNLINGVTPQFAQKFLQIAKDGAELSQIDNFQLQIVRDGTPMSIGTYTDDEGEECPIVKFTQPNINFTKLKNFTKQVNSLTEGYKDCSLKTDLFTVKFKGGRFAINAEKLLSEITEEYFRQKTGMPIVQNESPAFEAVMDKFVDAFVGTQTSILNYIALVDVFDKANNGALRNIGKLMSIDEDTEEIVFSQELLALGSNE